VSYFEMEVMNDGGNAEVAIGYAFNGYTKERNMPGWYYGSIGYHGLESFKKPVFFCNGFFFKR